MRCGLSFGAETPLAILSGGQRNRAALAGLIVAEPDFLLLDEPTNNLDREGRRAVIDLIQGWSGGALIVSHDREVLEEMDAIVEITSLGVARHGGNYSSYCLRKDLELAAAGRDLADAEKAGKEAARRAQQAGPRWPWPSTATHASYWVGRLRLKSERRAMIACFDRVWSGKRVWMKGILAME